jgi:hypothetical protein
VYKPLHVQTELALLILVLQRLMTSLGSVETVARTEAESAHASAC